MPDLTFIADGLMYTVESDHYNVTLKVASPLERGKPQPANGAAEGFGTWRVLGYYNDLGRAAAYFVTNGFNEIPGPLDEAWQRWADKADAFIDAVKNHIGEFPAPGYKKTGTQRIDKAKRKAQTPKPAPEKKKAGKLKFRRPKS